MKSLKSLQNDIRKQENAKDNPINLQITQVQAIMQQLHQIFKSRLTFCYNIILKLTMQQQMNGYSLLPCILMPSEDGGYFYLPIYSAFNQIPQIQCYSYIPTFNISSPPTELSIQIDSPSEHLLQPSISSTEEALPTVCSYLEKAQTGQVQRSQSLPYSPLMITYIADCPPLTLGGELSAMDDVKQNKRKRKEKLVSQPIVDLDYSPAAQRRKKATARYQENQNRNVIPNQINQIFSFLQKRNKSGKLLQKLIERIPHPAEYSARRYYLYQSLLKSKLGHYTNERSLKVVMELYEPKCESWSEEEQRYYNKLSRVLIRHFLNQDSIFIILTSKRMKKEKKGDHIRARRYVQEAALKILKGY